MIIPKYELLKCLGCDTMFHRAKIYDMNKVIGPVSEFSSVNLKKISTIIKKNIESNIWIKIMVATQIPNIQLSIIEMGGRTWDG